MIKIYEWYMNERNGYILNYTTKDGFNDSYYVYGKEKLLDALKWLNSDEVKATRIRIYKMGKDFENNKDDIIEVYRNYWKG